MLARLAREIQHSRDINNKYADSMIEQHARGARLERTFSSKVREPAQMVQMVAEERSSSLKELYGMVRDQLGVPANECKVK